jgi:hypothetical protein
MARDADATAQRAPAGHVDVAVVLDAREPFLNDHRPGGQPLLGTAMGVELMFRTARGLTADSPSAARRLERVAVFAPLILQGESATVVHVRAERGLDEPRGAVRCRVESQPAGQPPLLHFEGLCVDAEPAHASPREAVRVARDDRLGVDGAQVYDVFFHGPAFQVVAHASLAGDGMVCEWQRALPPWTHATPEATQPDPRWIELCLQTAGLLELATTQRMLIPQRIDSVEHVDAALADRGERMLARARRAAAGDAIDIDLRDDRDTLLLRVRGYRTVPLPFASDMGALQALARRFTAT